MGSSQADELSLSHDLSTTLSRPTTQERFLTFSEEAPALRSYGICRVFQRVEEVRVCLSLSLSLCVCARVAPSAMPRRRHHRENGQEASIFLEVAQRMVHVVLARLL